MSGACATPPITGPNAQSRTACGRIAVLSALLVVLLTAPARAQPPEIRVIPVAVLPFKMLDTSGEPNDQTAEHAGRLERLGRELASDLPRAGAYRTTYLPAERVAEACPIEEAGCLLDLARDQGAELLFVGVVHKSSTLILQLWARLVDVRTGRDLVSRDLNFRGDTDDAWQRARAFLVAQLRDARSRR